MERGHVRRWERVRGASGAGSEGGWAPRRVHKEGVGRRHGAISAKFKAALAPWSQGIEKKCKHTAKR